MKTATLVSTAREGNKLSAMRASTVKRQPQHACPALWVGTATVVLLRLMSPAKANATPATFVRKVRRTLPSNPVQRVVIAARVLWSRSRVLQVTTAWKAAPMPPQTSVLMAVGAAKARASACFVLMGPTAPLLTRRVVPHPVRLVLRVVMGFLLLALTNARVPAAPDTTARSKAPVLQPASVPLAPTLQPGNFLHSASLARRVVMEQAMPSILMSIAPELA